MGEPDRWNGRLISVTDLDEIARELVELRVQPGTARFNFTINAAIIRHFLGDGWFRDHLHPDYAHHSSFLRPDFSAAQLDPKFSVQTLQLAEMLLNLQSVGGFGERLEHMALKQVQSGLAELQIGQLLKSRGVPFRFVERGDPTNVDVIFQLPNGVEGLGEIKCKEEDTAYSDATLTRALTKARQQIGKGNAGVVFVKVPVAWVDITQSHASRPAEMALPTRIVAAAKSAMRGSARIKKIIFYILHHAYDPDWGLSVTHVTMEMTNARNPASSPWTAELLGPQAPGHWVGIQDIAKRWA